VTKEAKVEIRQLADFRPDENNANTGTQRGLTMLDKSISEDGAGRSLLATGDGVLIAGNKTQAALMERGIEEVIVVHTDGTRAVIVQRDDVQAGTDRARLMGIRDNRTSEIGLNWSAEQIAADLADGLDLSGLFYDNEIAEICADIIPEPGEPPEPRTTLAERFIVPPFSVLDARQGYWQERKRAWIALGIESELGRGGGITWGDAPEITESGLNYYRNRSRLSPGGSPRPAMKLGKDGKTNRGDGKGRSLGAIPPNQATILSPDYKDNGLLGESQQARSHYKGKEIATDKQSQSKLTAMQRGSAKDFGTEGNASEQTGTSIFDPVLCELAYAWFCPLDGKVFDPFAGGSVRGIVAAKLGRKYTGIDLSAEQIAANEVQASAILEHKEGPAKVKVSSKWLRHKFACSVDYIKNVCHGGCCEGSGRILISLLPDEQESHRQAGFDVKDGLLQADPKTGKCPHKLSSGLCGVHGTDMKPFGCIASPFTLNSNNTLIVRNRYTRMKCHGQGELAYKVFRASLDLIFGGDEAGRICAELDAGAGDIMATMPRKSYDALLYLDGLKHGMELQDGEARWIVGNSLESATLAPGEYDYIFSCPPYYNLEVYSDAEGDLSNCADYAEFLVDYRRIIASAVAMLKDNRFACFVVGDIRDKKGLYRNFVSDTISAFQDAGAILYNEAILVTAVGSLPIRVSAQFPKGRKLGKTHQNVLVFIKGDWRKAVEACGKVEVSTEILANE